ncbi:MAG TPA: YdcF family protein [Longimicrobium sp.]|nr:YdcF family protein [Longimicrobium sp.]
MARLKRIVVRMALAGTGLFVAAAGLIAVSGLRDDIRPADAAVVLGNEVRTDGTPHPRLAARLDAALALYDRGVVKNVIVSGGIGASGFDEAAVMKSYLARRGIPADRIVADSLGVTTAATATNTAAILRQQKWSSVVVVSQYFHIPRCRLAMRRAGITPVYSAHARYWELRDVYSTAREVVGYPAYLLGART